MDDFTGKSGQQAAMDAAGFEVAGQQAGIGQQGRAMEEIRRLLGMTAQGLGPFIQAGGGAIPGLTASATVPGIEGNLNQILDSESFRELTAERERAARGQLAAGGLTRSGTALEEISAIPTDLAFQIENELQRRQAALVGGGQNAALGLGSLTGAGSQNLGDLSTGIASLLASQGESRGAGRTVGAAATAAGAENVLNTALTLASIFFSDPKLKENVEKISEIKDLNLYQWDWIPETKGTIVEKCETIGFMADEVNKKYPHRVAEYCGFKVIDYPGLLDEMEAHHA